MTLNCGAAPITIAMPAVTVAHDTELSSLQPGTVTFTHFNTLFSVINGATFNVSGVSFNRSSAAATALRADSSTVQTINLSNATVSGYTAFAVLVGNFSTVNITTTTF
ncbi:MAG TPA: hypothetical protein VHW01_29350 [Polyangiaceae bacterium]|nr:hypothetical protein [Polyangiaceae bacterium]